MQSTLTSLRLLAGSHDDARTKVPDDEKPLLLDFGIGRVHTRNTSKGERIGFPRFSAAELHFLQDELGKDRSVSWRLQCTGAHNANYDTRKGADDDKPLSTWVSRTTPKRQIFA